MTPVRSRGRAERGMATAELAVITPLAVLVVVLLPSVRKKRDEVFVEED